MERGASYVLSRNLLPGISTIADGSLSELSMLAGSCQKPSFQQAIVFPQTCTL